MLLASGDHHVEVMILGGPAGQQGLRLRLPAEHHLDELVHPPRGGGVERDVVLLRMQRSSVREQRRAAAFLTYVELTEIAVAENRGEAVRALIEDRRFLLRAAFEVEGVKESVGASLETKSTAQGAVLGASVNYDASSSLARAGATSADAGKA